ncbi:11893_t:CDS:2, partial [Acaulospora colombiana]
QLNSPSNDIINRTQNPQRKNEEKGREFVFISFESKTHIEQHDKPKNGNREATLENKKVNGIEELPSDPITDFFKIIDGYAKIQVLIKKAKESRQKDSRLVAWDFFCEDLRPVTFESMYQNDKDCKKMDLNYDEKYIGEASLHMEKHELPSAQRFLKVEMEDVYQFLSSRPSSPTLNIFEPMGVDETMPSFIPQLEKDRKPSILQRLGRKDSTFPTPANSDKCDADLTDPWALPSADAEYDYDREDKKSSIIVKEPDLMTIILNENSEETKEGLQDELKMVECQSSKEYCNSSSTTPNSILDLCNRVLDSPHLTRAESNRQEKIQKRKNKYKKPQLHDRRKVENDMRKKEHHIMISENRNKKIIPDDNDRSKKEALRARELNLKENNHDEFKDDDIIFRKERRQSPRATDRHNKESPGEIKKDFNVGTTFLKLQE